MSFSEAGPSGLCHIASSASSSRSSSSESSDQNGVKRLRVGSECVVEATSREGRRGITRTARQSRGEERAAARPRRVKTRSQQRLNTAAPSLPSSSSSSASPFPSQSSTPPVLELHPFGDHSSHPHPLTLHPSSSPASPVVINLCSPTHVSNAVRDTGARPSAPARIDSPILISETPSRDVTVLSESHASSPLSHLPRAAFEPRTHSAVPPTAPGERVGMSSDFVNIALASVHPPSSSSSVYQRRVPQLGSSPGRHSLFTRIPPQPQVAPPQQHLTQPRMPPSLLMNGGANPSVHYVPPTHRLSPPPAYLGLSVRHGGPIAPDDATPHSTSPHGYRLRSRPPTTSSAAASPQPFVVPSPVGPPSSAPGFVPAFGTVPTVSQQPQPPPPWERMFGHGVGGAGSPLSHLDVGAPEPIDLGSRIDHSTAYIAALRREMRQAVPGRAAHVQSVPSLTPQSAGPTPSGAHTLSYTVRPSRSAGDGGVAWGRSRQEVPVVSTASTEAEVIIVDDSDDDDIVAMIDRVDPHHPHQAHPSSVPFPFPMSHGPDPAVPVINRDPMEPLYNQPLFGFPMEHLASGVGGGAGPSGVVVAGPSVAGGPVPHAPHRMPVHYLHRDGQDERSQAGAGNFRALATHVQNWTPADARRFLHVASHGGRRRMRSRRELMRAAAEIPPTVLFGAIMGSRFSPGTIGNSYEELLELAERLGPARPQGLGKPVIDALPVREFERQVGSEESNCVVCMCNYEPRDKLRSLPCAHEFHKQCIDPWFKDHKTCPICRVEVVAS